jgi:pimeloyl-ACP methyl ester carboxylesterase
MIDNSVLYKSPASYATMMARYDADLEAWPVPYESRYVETRHGRTHLLIAGEKRLPPLVYFHGWGGNATLAAGDLDLPALTRQYRVYAPDTIGQFGRSAPTRPAADGPAYGEWIADLFDALEIEQANVTGISGGGYLALKIAAYAPERVAKAFVISTSGIAGATSRSSKLLGLFIDSVPTVLWPRRLLVWLAQRYRPPAADPDKVQAVAEGLLDIAKHCKRFPQPGTLSDEELQRITAPVFILMGKHDPTCDVDRVIERAHRLIANVHAEIVEDAGHVLTMDRPDLVNTRLLEFFGSGTGSSTAN